MWSSTMETYAQKLSHTRYMLIGAMVTDGMPGDEALSAGSYMTDEEIDSIIASGTDIMEVLDQKGWR